jgi:hypothetical protein
LHPPLCNPPQVHHHGACSSASARARVRTPPCALYLLTTLLVLRIEHVLCWVCGCPGGACWPAASPAQCCALLLACCHQLMSGGAGSGLKRLRGGGDAAAATGAYAADFLTYVNASPSPYHAVEESERRLVEAGAWGATCVATLRCEPCSPRAGRVVSTRHAPPPCLGCLHTGFVKLSERESWVESVKPLGKYFVTRNQSSIVRVEHPAPLRAPPPSSSRAAPARGRSHLAARGSSLGCVCCF